MPNWCENNLTIYGSEDKINELENVIVGYEGHGRDFFGYCPNTKRKPKYIRSN